MKMANNIYIRPNFDVIIRILLPILATRNMKSEVFSVISSYKIEKKKT